MGVIIFAIVLYLDAGAITDKLGWPGLLTALVVLYELLFGLSVVPFAPAATVVCTIKPNNTLAVHLGKRVPRGRTFSNAVFAVMRLAPSVGAKRIELRSAIFGKEDHADTWRLWLAEKVTSVAPHVRVTIVDREPLSWFRSWTYRIIYGKQKTSEWDSGRLKAARIVIENF